MNNPYEKRIENGSVKQVLEIAAKASKFEIDSAAEQLTAKEAPWERSRHKKPLAIFL